LINMVEKPHYSTSLISSWGKQRGCFIEVCLKYRIHDSPERKPFSPEVNGKFIVTGDDGAIVKLNNLFTLYLLDKDEEKLFHLKGIVLVAVLRTLTGILFIRLIPICFGMLYDHFSW